MIIIIAPAIIVEGYSISTNDNEFNPLNRDAKKYASEYEIDLESAIHRLTIQHLAGGLDAELSTQEYKTYAGLWIQHDPQFRIVVLFTQDGQETIQPYIDNEPLEYYVDLRIAKVPLLELVSAQETVLNTVDELGIPAEFGINVFENRVELYVTDSIRLETLIKDTGIQLPDYVEIIKVNGLSTDTADIYGGLTLSTCTSGFSVKHTGGETGIVTASHCANV